LSFTAFAGFSSFEMTSRLTRRGGLYSGVGDSTGRTRGVEAVGAEEPAQAPPKTVIATIVTNPKCLKIRVDFIIRLISSVRFHLLTLE
jgi:hypothetical protein